MIKFGKSIGNLLEHKRSFFKDNERMLKSLIQVNNFFSKQPPRLKCKNCNFMLGAPMFQKHEVAYTFCSNCGHLNGVNDDTTSFCEFLYTDSGGKEYGKTYSADDKEQYFQRVNDIYVPKANFLKESLEKCGEKPAELSYADLGAGSGYFIAALNRLGISNATGYEVSKSQTDLARIMFPSGQMQRHEMSDLGRIAAALTDDVVSLIGVLEHLQNPREILEILNKNKKLSYAFITFTLFSPCVFFEMCFPEVMPRQLAGGHTHLYTRSSVKYLCEEFHLIPVSQWWFGTDMVDLFRSMTVMLEKTHYSQEMIDLWKNQFQPMLDDLQITVDKNYLSSQVHMVLKFEK